jgi:hypothetical protein
MRVAANSDPKQSGSSERIRTLSERLRERLTEENLLQMTITRKAANK